MKQYYQIKSKHPDSILLFRVGDFYETFGDDAIKAARILGITLTKRSNGAASSVALAGFPHHALETYLPKLVKAGQRVAVCDQLEEPQKGKKIVKRGVTEMVTPGTAINDHLLEHKQNNFLGILHFDEKDPTLIGIALLDLSTGEFFTTEGKVDYIQNLIKSLSPTEIIVAKGMEEHFLNEFGNHWYYFSLQDYLFTESYAKDKLLQHFQTQSLKGFGIEELHRGIIASGIALHYLENNHHQKLAHFNKITRLEQDTYVWLDRFTIRNLELTSQESNKGATLAGVLDKTLTPMGGRLLKQWLAMPLKDRKSIEKRQEIVKTLVGDEALKEAIAQTLKQIGDLERLVSKAALLRINPREVQQIQRSIAACQSLKKRLEKHPHPDLQTLADELHHCEALYVKIEKTIADEPPVGIQKGGLIKAGVDANLDEYRDLCQNGKAKLLEIQQREMEATGISSLKLSFNNVFGYYLEVRNTHKSKVPESWTRKQTLVNAERYVTEELKTYEEKILQAEEKVLELEKAHYLQLLQEISTFIPPLQKNAAKVAFLDVLWAFADVAIHEDYCCPEINDGLQIKIAGARHPVIEQNLPIDEPYIPNDLFLDNESRQIIILTGPNMSGKSAVLRQTALIVLMAQMGAFVPAKAAEIGIVDKIFTRVGASDNLAGGESTFMVEMTETASILNNISERSLILLDEIGRGTSTYDGISIAWSITEFLHQHPCKPKTFFATHYHELNELEKRFENIENFHISIKEHRQKIIFLRKLVKGGSRNSFGVQVAAMAGVPKEVVKRAKTILKELEKQRKNIKTNTENLPSETPVQLSLFEAADPKLEVVKEKLEALDINNLKPIDALMKLNELKDLLEEKA